MRRARTAAHRRSTFRPLVLQLEDRLVPTVFQPLHTVLQPGAAPLAGNGPGGGYSPAQMQQAYGFSAIKFGSVTGDGTGMTIAIVDAYDDPSIEKDLGIFDAQFGLAAPPSFQVVNQAGQVLHQAGSPAAPKADVGWAEEISLDVEWAHAIAPNAKILLVEANSSFDSDLLAAVDYASAHAQVVSMSWGGGEFTGEATYDSHFSHAGVTYIASAGDSGSPAEWPSISTHVLAVGGTALTLNSSSNWSSETTWHNSAAQGGGTTGGGPSSQLAEPTFQQSVVPVSMANGKRTSPDVAYNADPYTGVSVYDDYGGDPGWMVFGGTSAGAPQWAALIAIADQGLALQGKGSLSYSDTLSKIYQLSSSDFHDITTGNNGTYSAVAGYDLVTGRGTPIANLVVGDLVGATSSVAPPSITATTATPSTVTSTSTQLAVTASDPNAGATITKYTWAVQSGPAAVGFGTNNGTSTGNSVTATFTQAGSYTFQVTVTDSLGASATSTVNVTVQQTLTSITVAATSVADGTSKQLTATASDQFGKALATQPAFTWSFPGTHAGALTAAGLYTAPASGSGADTVTATSGTVSGNGTVTYSGVAAPAAPTNVKATGGNTQVTLTWTLSSGATSYQIFRGTSPGGEGASAIATLSSTATSYTNTGLTNGVTYYYKVAAVNSGGSTLSAEVSATPNVASGIKIDAGGGAISPFVADVDATGGATRSTSAAIATAGVAAAAPAAVYQSQRYGNFTYTIPNLTAGATYTVRLHFAEFVQNGRGLRTFGVAINGTTVLGGSTRNFDVFATAGGFDKALVLQFNAVANSSGKISIVFTNGNNNAIVNGIEIIAGANAAKAPAIVLNLGNSASFVSSVGPTQSAAPFAPISPAPVSFAAVRILAISQSDCDTYFAALSAHETHSSGYEETDWRIDTGLGWATDDLGND